MKPNKYVGKYSNFKYSVLSFLKVNKVKLFVLGFIVVLGLFTGILTAIKYVKGADLLNFNDYAIKEFAKGNIASTSLFFKRFLSYACFLLILLVCSLTAFLFPVGCLVVIYRSYLLGLNITILICLYGLGGIVSSILIIFPAQLLMIVLSCMFFCMLRNRCIVKKKFGKVNGVNCFVLFLIFVGVLSVINLLETLLLVLFSGQVILVI